MRYLGGKNACGTFQRIINQIPPHAVYVEPFCGSTAIARRKRPARETILIDRNPDTVENLKEELERQKAQGDLHLPPFAFRLLCADGLAWLEDHGPTLPADSFVYADPPYLRSTRTSHHRYLFELDDPEAHLRILSVLKAMPCPVLLSGYWSQLYADNLTAACGWRIADSFRAITRGGTMATEYLWANYPQPVELHDYRFLGQNFRERERFVRQKKRWKARLAKMTVLQRRALLSALDDAHADADRKLLTPPPPARRDRELFALIAD